MSITFLFRLGCLLKLSVLRFTAAQPYDPKYRMHIIKRWEQNCASSSQNISRCHRIPPSPVCPGRMRTLFWKHDQQTRRLDREHSTDPQLNHLRQHGYAMIDSLGIDVPRLQREAQHLLRGKKSPIVQIHNQMRYAPMVLNATNIFKTIHAYLGDARYDGHVLLLVRPGVKLSDYGSGRFHHDRCGRRLKLFLFVNDVDESTHPTIVADRTHNWFHDCYVAGALGGKYARFDDAEINHLNLKLVPMTGKAGGGFLFDTNSIHKGQLHGSKPRTAVIFEFHSHGKIPNFLGSDGNPCPSNHETPFDVQLLGVPNFPQFPQESVTEAHCLRAHFSVKGSSDCVWSQGVCHPHHNMCLAIEQIPKDDWRQKVGTSNENAAPPAVLYKPHLAPNLLSSSSRRIYMDLGANTYGSSIGGWFKAHYPQAESFRVIAFEATRQYDKSYVGHADVELIHKAVWTENTSMSWVDKFVTTSRGGGPQMNTIDFVEFIQRFHETDYIVVKMDIEGAEWHVLRDMIERGATSLVDELFLEMHTDINSCCRGKPSFSFPKAMAVVQKLREHHVYTHVWG